MSPVKAPLLSPRHAALLLERVIYEEVLRCVRIGKLRDLEEMLAVELLQVEAIDERELLPLVREMIARALVRCVELTNPGAEQEARTRYLDCICREALPDAGDAAGKAT